MSRFRAVVAILLAVSFAVSGTIVVARAYRERGTPSDAGTPSPAVRSGKELVMVFIGASFCGATETPGLPKALKGISEHLARRAERENSTFVRVGVALDWKTNDGLRFLRHFGEFDEILVGRNWLNTGAIDYIWRGLPGAPALPQVLVFSRLVDARPTTIAFTEDELLTRKAGADAILDWAAREASLPGESTTSPKSDSASLGSQGGH